MKDLLRVLPLLAMAILICGGAWELWMAFDQEHADYARACFGWLILYGSGEPIRRMAIVNAIKDRR